MNKNASKSAYYGATGQGKSTGVKARIKKEPRVIVFDPMREYHREPGFTKARSLKEVKKLMIAGRAMRYKIAYQPTTTNYEQALHELCQFLLIARKPYYENKSRNQIVLVVEELNMAAPSHALPKYQSGFKQAVLQGRHYGLNIIGVTQRPKMVAAYFRDQVETENVYRLACADSVKYISKKIMDDRFKDAIFNLKPHEYLQITPNSVKKCKNKLS